MRNSISYHTPRGTEMSGPFVPSAVDGLWVFIKGDITLVATMTMMGLLAEGGVHGNHAWTGTWPNEQPASEDDAKRFRKAAGSPLRLVPLTAEQEKLVEKVDGLIQEGRKIAAKGDSTSGLQIALRNLLFSGLNSSITTYVEDHAQSIFLSAVRPDAGDAMLGFEADTIVRLASGFAPAS